MKKKKLLFLPANVAEKIEHLRTEDRLLSAVGQFDSKQTNFWYPVHNYLLTAESIDEANAVFHRLCKTLLRNQAAMRRFCAANPDARVDGYWCPTFDFVYYGVVNNYRLRCMHNHGDFNYLLVVYQKQRKEKKLEAA